MTANKVIIVYILSQWPRKTNYQSITAFLEARELYGHVDGTLTHPSASDNSSGASAAFEKAQKKTKALIVTSIRSDLIYLITECKTPKEIWDTLKQRFREDRGGYRIKSLKDISKDLS